MNKISAVIITLNEESRIGRCIGSIHDIVDEVIVVDSLSTDRTEEICGSFEKVRFIKQPFLGYMQQKNFAKDQVSGDFVLSLDADEELDNVAREEIKKIRNNAGADAYSWRRMNHYCGRWIKHGAWYPDRKIRLWRKGKGVWTGMGLHEKIGMADGSKVLKLKGHILHYTVEHMDEYIARINTYSTISANDMYKRGIRHATLRIIINPCFRFVRDYFIKLGFMDGYYGFFIAVNTSYSVFLKYAKLRMMILQKRHNEETLPTKTCQ